MVAGVQVAIMFQGSRHAALRCEMAESGTRPKPVAQRNIKELHKRRTHIMVHPLVKYADIKVRQPLWGYAPWC